MSPQMAREIRWNVPGLYQHKAHRLHKRITEHPDIFTKNENGKIVVYGNLIDGSNFKLRCKSMVSNHKNLDQVSIYEFLLALRSLGVTTDDIGYEKLNIKYSNVAPYSTHKRHSTPTIRMRKKMIMWKNFARQVISNKFIKTIQHHLQDCHKVSRAMFTSNPGASIIFSIFINLLCKLLLTILFYFISYTF